MSVNDSAGPARGTRAARSIRRRWWVVLAVLLVAIPAGVASTFDAATTYTGRSSMIVSSNNRSPDQDAVLVQGYVEYFNNGAYQAEVLERAGVDGPVSVTARSSASSPIMIVEATTTSRATAQWAATHVASVIREDVNEERAAEKAREVAALEARIDELVATPLTGSDYEVQLIQQRIAAVQADRTNELQVLQLAGGVATTPPDRVTNVLLAGLGGLLLGILAALGVDALLIRRTAASPPPRKEWARSDALSTKV